jgi:transketolase
LILIFDEKQASVAAKFGPRAYFGLSLHELAKTDSSICAVSADLGRSSGLDRFRRDFPERYINAGIAEQNMILVSAGLARAGMNVFASSFAPFISARSIEQVRMNLSYMQEPVTLVALGSGLAMGQLGNSHFGLEDISIMRSLPNITIVCPCDCFEIAKSLRACADYKQPVYLRLTGSAPLPIVHTEDYQFQIGSANWLRPKQRVNIIASGSSVAHSLEASKILFNEGLNVGVLNMHTIHPLDENALNQCLFDAERLFVVEEHFRNGGLGTAVLEYISDNWRGDSQVAKVNRHGLPKSFMPSGSYEFLLDKFNLNGIGIANHIRAQMEYSDA